jgi:hypothetical protein
MQTQLDTWMWFAAILAGLGSCFYGYPLFRILLILDGLIYGYLFGHIWAPASHPWLSLTLGIISAIVLALVAYPLWSIGVAVVGAALGFIFLSSIGLVLNTSQVVTILLGLLGAVVLGFLFLKLRDLFVMIATALNGAALLVLGLSVYIPVMAFRGGGGNILDIVIMVVLGAFGFSVQYGMFKDRRTYSTPK